MKAAPQVNPYLQQSRPRAKRFAMRPVAYCVALACCELAAAANPSGPQVMQGAVQMQGLGTSNLKITNSPGSIIHWQGFSIGAGSTTQFIQQNTASSVLNRVVGADISQIHGQLLSNGRVFLINPAGILIGAGAVIDTAGFVGSTLNMQNADFLAGKLRFEGSGGAIQNAGTLRSSGDIFLVGSTIENSGIIRSDAGSVVLAAGKSVTIASPTIEGVVFTMQAPEDRVVNLGSIEARDAAGLFAGTLRHSGDIRAGGLGRDSSGRVVLLAQKDAIVDGGATISADNASGKGGSVRVLGERVGVLGTASLSARGAEGGGEILVGGDYQGSNPLVPNAVYTYFGKDAKLDASATARGDGGRVILWADKTTRAYGSIFAKGGAAAGDGGFVEVSGKGTLDFRARGDVSAPRGKAGTLLLDPTDITLISDFSAGSLDPELTPQADFSIFFADDPTGSTLRIGELQAAWNPGTTIRLEASNDINLGLPFVLGNGVNLTVVPNADNIGGGKVNLSQNITLNNGTFTLGGTNPVMDWTGGVIAGTAPGALGTFSIPAGATVNVSGATRAVTNLTINNGGTWNMGMADGNSLQLNTNSAFNNSAGAIVDFNTANNNAFTTTVGTSTFSNLGIIRTTSTGFGQIAIAGGTLNLTSTNGTYATQSTGGLFLQQSTGTYSGITTFLGNNVQFSGGTHTFANNGQIFGRLHHAGANVTMNLGTTAANNMTLTGVLAYDPVGGAPVLNINGALTVNGGIEWASGNITAASAGASLTTPFGTTVTVTGDTRGFLGAALAVNNGGQWNLNMNNTANLQLGGSAVFTNQATGVVEFQGVAGITNRIVDNGSGAIVNSGIIRNVGDGTAALDQVATGLALTSLDGATYSSGAGPLNILPSSATYTGTTNILGTNVVFPEQGHVFAANSVVNGRINHTGTADFTFNGNATLNGLLNYVGVAGSTIAVNGGGTLALNGGMNWGGVGTLTGAGGAGITIAGGTTVNLSAGSHTLDSFTVNNAGTVGINLPAGGALVLNNTTFNNNTGGVIEFQSSLANSVTKAGAPASTLANSGGTIRNANIGAAQVSNVAGFTMTSAGGNFATTSTGTLQLNAPTNTYSGTTMITGTAVEFANGTHTFANNSVVNGRLNHTNTADLVFNGNTQTNGLYNYNPTPGGTLTINGGTLTLAGGMTWVDNGTITGTGAAPALTIPAGQTFTMNGFQRGFTTLTVNNAGTLSVQMDDSTALLLENSTLNNSGLLEFPLVGIFNALGTAGGGASTLTNTGTIRVTGDRVVEIYSATAPEPLAFNNNGGTLSENAAAAGNELRLRPTTGNYTGITTIEGNNVRFTAGTHNYSGTVRATAAGSSFNLAGGTHNFNDGSALDLRNNLNLTPVGAATINFNGTGSGTTIVAGSTISLPAAAFFGGAGKIVNEGTLNIPASAQIDASFDNRGTLDISTGQTGTFAGTFFDQTSGTLQLNGTSTFRKDAGAFNWVGGSLSGTGTIDLVNGAAFNIVGGGARTLAGPSLAVANLVLPGGSLTVQSGTFTLTGTTTIANTASLILSGGAINTAGSNFTLNGTLQADVPMAAAGFTLNATGTLSGTAAVTGNTLNWTGGTIAGAGTKTFDTTITSSGTPSLTGNLQLTGGTWTNTGSLTQSGAGRVTLTAGATVNNNVGGVWTLSGTDTTPIVHGTGAGTTFNNAGTFTNNAPGIVHTLTPTNFNNTNLVHVIDGTLVINANGVHSGRFDIDAAALEFAGGVQQMNAGAQILGAGLTRLSGGTLSNAVDVTLNGPFTWTGGTVTGAGLFTTEGTSTITGNSVVLSDSRWTNTGNATLTGSIALGGSGAIQTTFTNAGTLMDASFATSPILTATTATNKSFVNSGIFNKNAGSANFQGLDAPFTNTATGTVNVNAGTLSVPAFATNAGTIVLQGTTLTTNGNALGNTGEIRGSGTVNLGGQTLTSSGALDFTGASTITGALAMTAGTLEGGGPLNVTGGYTWTGGTLSNTGGVTIAGTTAITAGAPQLTGTLSTSVLNVTGGTPSIAGGVLNITGGAQSTLSNVTLTNDGRINFASTASLLLDNATLANNGTFDLQSAAGMEGSAAGGTFNNAGTLTKSVAGTSALGVGFPAGLTFVNTGTLSPDTGATINYAGMNQFNGGTQFSGAGTNRVTHDSVFGGTVTSNGSLVLESGDFSGNGSLAGTPTWTGGRITGPLTVVNGATLNLTGTADKFVASTTLTNDGRINLAGTGNLVLDNATLNNNATFDLQSAAGVEGSAFGGTFNNVGSVTKSAGAASGFGVGFPAGLTFVNSGTLSPQNGMTIIYAGVNQFNNFTQSIDLGTNRVTGNSTFTGNITSNGNLILEAGDFNGNGSFAGTTVWTGGRITGPLTVSNGAILLLTGTGDKSVAGTTLTNAGQIHLAGTGNLVLDNATLNNNSTFDLQSTAGIEASNFGGTFNNVGTLTKSMGTTSGLGVGFPAALTFINSGMLTPAAGTTINYAGVNQFNSGTQFLGAGTHLITSSSALTGNVTIGGSGSLTLDNSVTLTNNGTTTRNGTGGILVNASSTFLNAAGRVFDLNAGGGISGAGTFQNNGTVNSAATGVTQVGTVFTNAPGGTLAISAGTLAMPGLTANAGTVTLSNGATLATNGNNLNNTGTMGGVGTIDVGATQTLTSSNALDFSGASTVTGSVAITGGTLRGAGPVAISGGLTLTGGSLTNTGGVTVAGTTSVNTGAPQVSGKLSTNGLSVASGVLDVVTGGTLELTGASPKSVSGTGVLRNAGTVNFNSGTMNVTTPAGSTPLVNLAGGTFNIGTGVGNIDFNSTQTFTNAGTLTSAGTHQIGSGASTHFHNTGAVVVTSGTLSLLMLDVDSAGPSGDTGSYTAMAGSTMRFRDANRDFLAGSAIGGGGFVRFDSFSGGTFRIAGTYNPASATVIDGNTTVNFDSAATLPALQLPGTFTGQVGGQGALTLNALSWQGGSIVGSGVFRTAGTTTVSGAGAKSVTGRPWDNTGDLTIGGGAVTADAFTNPGTTTLNTTLQLNQNFDNAGTLVLNTGSTLRAGPGVTAFSNSSLLKGVGTIDMNTNAPAVAFVNTGTLAPGASPGIMMIAGNFTQGPAGTLALELGGTTPGALYDQLQVTGVASLAGALTANWFGGYTGTPGDVFNVMTFGSRVGDFTSFTPPTGGVALSQVPGLTTYALAAAGGGGGAAAAAGNNDTTKEVRRLYDRFLALIGVSEVALEGREIKVCE